MNGFVDNIEQLTLANNKFRHVLYTGKYSQLVLMTLRPSEEIGEEIHAESDQFFRVDSGEGTVVIDDKKTAITDGFAVIVPAGARHNVINSGDELLKLYTIYSPPHHRDGVIHATKAEAEQDDEEFEGHTTE